MTKYTSLSYALQTRSILKGKRRQDGELQPIEPEEGRER